MTIAVVTALIGPAESPPPIGPKADGVRYIAFTDREVPFWECRDPPRLEVATLMDTDRRFAPAYDDPRRAARIVKTSLPELVPDVKAWIWIDASFDLIEDPRKIVADALCLSGCFDVYAFRHPDRDRIKDEAAVVARLGFAPAGVVGNQIAAYQRNGFDTDKDPQRALTTTGFMVFWNADLVRLFFRFWNAQIEHWTVRDQLSVDYAAKTVGVAIGYLPGHYRKNGYARYNRERHQQRRRAA